MSLVTRLLGLLIVMVVVAGCGPTEMPTSENATSDGGSALVVRVVDGDTLVVRLGEADITVRLLNVDAPETKDPNKAVECLGPEASAFLRELLPPGTAVQLEYDGKRLDRYGRTLAGVWLSNLLVNAEVAREGLGVPVQFDGQVKFLAKVVAAAEEAKRLENGAYADDVSCALPARVDKALSAMERVEDPSKDTAAAYAVTIAALVAARSAARKVRDLARTGRGKSGTAAWVFHDAVRAGQRVRVESGISDASDRLDDLESTMKTLKKEEERAEERKRERERARKEERARERERARRTEREQDARDAAEEQRQESESQPDTSEDDDSGGSNPGGYNGPRCYEPGGKVWHPC